MLAVRIAVAVAGAALVVLVLASAIKTIVVPRALATRISRTHFRVLRRVFGWLARPSRPFADRDRWLALYSPTALVALPATWVALVLVGFTGVFWGTGVHSLTDSVIDSGSSLFTLGFQRPPGTGRVGITFVEAGIGLGLVSLMISYLPTIYGAFSRREALVGMLEVRAGLPPSCAELLVRFQRIGWLDRIDDDLFVRWESWFVDVEESHTSQPSLVFFRSPHPDRHWLTAAGCVLDTAAVVASTVDRKRTGVPDILLRTGFFTLRRIADYFAIDYDPNPAPTDPISVSRREFDLLCVELQAAGVPLRADRDQCWQDFAGWRVNYDRVLVQLCGLTDAPPGRWSSDRVTERTRLTPLWRTWRVSRPR